MQGSRRGTSTALGMTAFCAAFHMRRGKGAAWGRDAGGLAVGAPEGAGIDVDEGRRGGGALNEGEGNGDGVGRWPGLWVGTQGWVALGGGTAAGFGLLVCGQPAPWAC